jgi:hypothetical protein
MLTSGTHARQMTAASALARSQDRRAFPLLRDELVSGRGPRKWRRHVSFVLARHYPAELLEWIEVERIDLAGADRLLWALARAEPQLGAAAAEKVLAAGRPAVRAAALRILARLRGAEMIGELRRLLREGKPRKVAQEAFWQLHRLGGAAELAVEAMLRSEHWQERRAAVCLLRRRSRLTDEQKARAEADEHVAVRQAARWHPDGRGGSAAHPE